jgi:UDP-N-acetylmuramoyl-tripeptide--D-alanyl-D-alanine ligase
MGYKLEDLSSGLSSVDLSPMRMDSKYLIDGTLLLNDSYNANPTSMNAAIDTILTSPRSRKIAVVGTMAELGIISEEAHRSIGERLSASDINWIAVAESRYGGEVVDTWKEALSSIAENAWRGEDTIILIKGSRIAGLDQLANAME